MMNLRNFSRKTPDAYAIFSYSDFRNFIAVRVLMTLAVQIQNATLFWMIYDITKDALSLGLIGLSEAIPSLAVALYAGHLADKIDRRKIVIWSTVLFLFTSISLFFITLSLNKEFLYANSYVIYLIVLISGFARGFFRPANFALMTQLVPRNLYASSAAWNSIFWQGASVSGATLGGVIIAYLSINASFLIAAVLVLGGLLLTTRIKPKPMPEIEAKQSLFVSLSMGVKFVFQNQVILGAMTLDLVAVLFGGAVALLPAFVKDVLFVGPIEYGLLNGATALGAIITAAFLAFKPPLKYAGRNLIVAVAGFGLCMIVFAVSKNFYISFVALAFSGMFDSMSVVIRSSIMQLLTPDNMRGRVSAVNTMFIGSSNELGAFESGLAAKWMGLIPSVVFGGSIAVVSALSSIRLAPQLRKLNLTKY